MLLKAGLHLHHICLGNTLYVWLATLHHGLVVEHWFVSLTCSVECYVTISKQLNYFLYSHQLVDQVDNVLESWLRMKNGLKTRVRYTGWPS